MVGVRIDANELSGLDVYPGFFFDLARGGLGQGLAGFDLATRNGVQIIVGATDQQYAALVILDEGAHSYGDAVGRWSGWVVEVIYPCHDIS